MGQYSLKIKTSNLTAAAATKQQLWASYRSPLCSQTTLEEIHDNHQWKNSEFCSLYGHTDSTW